MQFTRVLVTGAAGRLGTATLRLLAAHGVAVTALDRQEPEPGLADRTVIAEADDVAAVEQAVQGADAVIHAAALASPTLGTPAEVFRTNTLATFTVLDTAARLGVPRAAIASSFAITGLPRGGPAVRPDRLPIDEDSPLQVRDVYALTKQVDETTARMTAASTGMSIVALRLPLLGSPERTLGTHARRYATDPASGAADLWSYLDTRDAARACLAAITADVTGFEAVYVAAPNTLGTQPTEDLLDRHHPDVPRRRRFPGHEAPIDVRRAHVLLGFRAEYIYDPYAEIYRASRRPDEG